MKKLPVASVDIDSVVAESGKRLQDLVTSYLPKLSGSRRADLCKFISMTSAGIGWRKIEPEINLNWHQIQAYKRNSVGFGELYMCARANGEAIRVLQREEEAHRRAVEGWDEGVYFKGELCGQERKFSDRLLELLLKADNPKYRGESFSVNVQTNLLMDQLKGSSVAGLVDGSQSMPDGDASEVIDISHDEKPTLAQPMRPVPPRRR